ncbi:MAG: ribonuclease D [Alphaproteobacteria bacterium]|nr:MAG: ribonuclease D [Alphaproteobacteria bacterium]
MIITTTAELNKYCAAWSKEPYITVDTEFMREKTYWPILCLIQVGDKNGAAAIDPLAKDLDLSPFFDVMRNESVIKVFHAARQDIEIFVKLMGSVPHPVVDTQVAAMVTGFGEQASYETLVQKLCGQQIDKSMRFTDWSQRPLSKAHIEYALGDVTHLRIVYEKIYDKAKNSGRVEWMLEEMNDLTDIATYQLDPYKQWERIRSRTQKPKFMAVLRELAAWREQAAQSRNVPRGRICKDDALLEITAHPPHAIEDFERYRHARGMIANRDKPEIIEACKRALATPQSEWPHVETPRQLTQQQSALGELLRVLLRIKSDEHGVAAKLIATSDDIDQIVRHQDDHCHALRGWRMEVFGKDALALREGKLALSIDKKGLKLLSV